MKSRSFLLLAAVVALALLLSLANAQAGSATWSSHPLTDDWNTPSNWVPNTVPNSPTDVATFGASDVTAISITDSDIDLDSAVFNSGAPPYTITYQVDSLGDYSLNLRGAGIINNSGVMQSFVLSDNSISSSHISFYNSASAGEMTSFSMATTGGFDFNDSSSAGSATFNLTGGTEGGPTSMDFYEGTTAANATINASGGCYIIFNPGADGGHATFNLTGETTYLQFGGNANVDHATVNCVGAYGILILGTATAGEGHFNMNAGSTSDEYLDEIYVGDSATAGNATFVIGGAPGKGLDVCRLSFVGTATAGSAKITATAGVNGGEGGLIAFHQLSEGDTCSISLQGNSQLNLGKHDAPGVSIGSLSGDGSVFLSTNNLTIGTNNQSTSFSGVIQGSGGVTKIGTGRLTLSGSNIYTGNTTVSGGVLVAKNKQGATGTGTVNVQVGTLGGRGMILGAVTVGTGSGSGAFLAPSVASKQPLTLACRSTVTFKSDSTYTCQLNSKSGQADQLLAKGITIESGAQFNLETAGNKRLPTGTVFTVISNTSANLITGTFANLADGAVISVGRNKLVASYEGGDGNDLTLTVQ